jgi:hypothetical protein
MRKRLGTVSGEDGAEVPQGRRLPNAQATVPHIKTWHPSRMKTGLRNHLIGKKVSLGVRKRAAA